MRRARAVGLGLAMVAAAGLTSCVRVPDQGPVAEVGRPAQAEPSQVPINNPPPPRTNAGPADIVSGYLEAMTATPLQTSTALKFLSAPAQAQWRPERVVTYSDRSTARGTGTRHVKVRLSGVRQVGAAGQWLGRGSPGASRITFPMTREDGQWRIAAAPNALIVPRDFYDANFGDASLYYFDPTGHILVPEPVHVPQGTQLASSLVKALLHGPRSGPGSVAQTFIPPGLSIGISVPVNRNVAEVNLKGADPGPLDQKVIKRILAQLAWTLRQDTSINTFTLTIAGHAVTDASGASRFSVRGRDYDSYDPAVSLASPQIYALKNGRLVSGQVDHPTPVDGPFGNEDLGIGPFAVNLDNTLVAGVRADALLVGSVLGRAAPTEVLAQAGLLRPSWDFADRLWEIGNGPDGAVVDYVPRGGEPHRVRVPGITGENVHGFLVSRDGSRIVAVLRGPARDHLVVSRLRYDADGAAIGATDSHRVPWTSSGTTRVRDIGWTSPTTIAVLDQLSQSQAEVRILNVDGSTPPDQAAPILVGGHVRALATSPNQTPYAVRSGYLSVISTEQILPRQIPVPGLHHVTYAG